MTDFGVRNLLVVAVYTGKMAGTRNDRIRELNDTITNAVVIFVFSPDPRRAIVIEHQQIKEIFRYGQGRILNCADH